MFDLFRSRQRSVRIILGLVLGMVAVSMLVYLIPGAGSSSGNKTDQVIAEVGDRVITVRDVESQIQSKIKRGELPVQMASIVIPQTVEQMTGEWASAYEAQRLGFRVTDKDLAETIRSISPQVSSLTPQQYKDFVEQSIGVTVPEFEENLRLGLYGQALESIAAQGIVVAPAELESEYHKRNDKIKLEYIAFDTNKILASLKPSQQELKDFFDKNRGFFTVQEARNVQFIIADASKLAQTMQVSDNDVRNYYNAHKEQFRMQDRVKARHILVMTQGKPADEVTKLKAKAEDLLKQIKAGGDFAKLAEKNSDDPGSAKNGGDLGWVVHGQMVAEFEKATFALQPKEISGIVTTPYGFHIIQVMEKEPAHLRTLEEAKDEIANGLKNQTMSDQMTSLMDKAHADLVKSPKNAAEIAKKYNLFFTENPKFTTGSSLMALAGDRNVSVVVTALKKGEVSDVTQSGNKLYLASVTDLIPPHPGEFAEAEPQVLSMYQQQHVTEVAKQQTDKAAEMVKSNGGDLKAAAKSLKLDLKTTDFFSRNGAVEGIGAGAAFADAFDKPVGTIVGPLRAGGDTVIAKILDKQAADMSKLPSEREAILGQLKGKKANERQALMRDSILTGLMKQGKVKIHKPVVDRLVAQYRARS